MPSLTLFCQRGTHKMMHSVAEKDANFRRRCCTNSQAGSHSLSLRCLSPSSGLPLLASTATLSRRAPKCDRRASVTLRSIAHWPGNHGDEDEENDGGGGRGILAACTFPLDGRDAAPLMGNAKTHRESRETHPLVLSRATLAIRTVACLTVYRGPVSPAFEPSDLGKTVSLF